MKAFLITKLNGGGHDKLMETKSKESQTLWWTPLDRPSLRGSGSAEVRQYAALCNKQLSLPCLWGLELGILRPPRAGSPRASISEEFSYVIFYRWQGKKTEDWGLSIWTRRDVDEDWGLHVTSEILVLHPIFSLWCILNPNFFVLSVMHHVVWLWFHLASAIHHDIPGSPVMDSFSLVDKVFNFRSPLLHG